VRPDGAWIDPVTLVRRLEDGSLPRSAWSHAAHLVAGTWFVRERGFAPACVELPTVIRRYNERTGTPNTDSSGYHETLTRAHLEQIARLVRMLPSAASLSDCVEAVCSSALADSTWPHQYWHPATLWSAQARAHWVEPDRQPLPR
jgi:hypothetical protein